ncbi:FtsX-like permease family protein [Nocardioides bruguierae]|uniref:FtsX-like permease family protein n=1 Tax=Nocardioides bruguierae TaxID=2945102 RepID=UPI002021F69D|nr:FtsX-like permease family protein [Nocardioides bruguierae]MCL8026653.1 hypothetical protein [Nocardioides bruguierae]
MARLPVQAGTLWRGLRSRGLLSLGTVLLTAVAVASAVLGPAFAGAVTSSYLVRSLAEAATPLTGLTWQLSPGGDAGTDPVQAQAAAADAAQALIEDAGADAAYAAPRTSLVSGPFEALGGEVTLLAAADACDHLQVTGDCPADSDEVLLLAGDATRTGLEIGDRVRLPGYAGEVRVVGTYAAPGADEADFWFDVSRFSSAPPTEMGAAPQPYRPAPFVTVPAAFDRLGWLGHPWTVRVDARLNPPADLTVDDLPAIEAVSEGHGSDDSVTGVAVAAGTLTPTGINDVATVIADITDEQGTAAASIAPAVLSLVLVALALLLRLLTAAADLRTPEMALATLRGLPRRGLWRLGLAEPLTLLGLAVPIGVALGVATTVALQRAWLVPGLPLRVPVSSVAAGLAVVVGSVAVAALAVRLVLRTGLDEQLAGVRRPGASRRSAVLAQLVLVALAVAAVVSRLTSGSSDPDLVDLVLPVLLASVAGLAASRLTQVLARWVTRRRPHGRSVAGWVAARTLSRRREGTLVILPLTAAVAIGVFGAGVDQSAAEWRASVAATRAPADQVWTSQLGLEETVALTRRLDPDGEWLMAAGAFYTTSESYAVLDTDRLAAVGRWPDSWTPGTDAEEVSDLLRPPGEIPEVAGTSLGVDVTNDLTSEEPVVVRLDLVSDGGDGHTVYSLPLPTGETTRLDLDLEGCARGCRLEGVTIGTTVARPTRLTGSLTLSGLTADGEPVADWLGPADWGVSADASSPEVVEGVEVTDDALTVDVDTGEDTAIVQLSTGGLGAALPVVAGVDAPAMGDDAQAIRTRGDIYSTGVLEASSVPLLGPVGRLVDVDTLTLDRSLYDQGTQTYVLARDGLPAPLRRALLRAGVTEDTTYAEVKAGLDSTPYALALRLYAVVALLVLVMALASLAVSTAVQLPARRRDAAALRVVGVPRRAVARAVLLELGVVLGGTAVAGLLAGTLAQVVVLRTLVLGYVDTLSTPALTSGVDVVRLVLLAVVAAVVLGVVAGTSAVLTVRGARGAVLREDGR